MRSFQRIRHQRTPTPRQQTHIRHAETRAVSRKRGVIWRQRGRRLLGIASVAAIVGSVWLLLRDSRVVVDGLVRADLAVVRAPAAARVLDVLVRPGERCHRGQPLVELEPLDTGELEIARLERDEKALRVELARRGGEIGLTELGRRSDLEAMAMLQLRLAEADLAVAEARQVELVRERETLALTLREQELGAERDVLGSEFELEGARIDVADALTARRLAAHDASNARVLAVDGIAPETGSFSADMDQERAMLDVDLARVAADGALEDLYTAEELEDLRRERTGASLLEMDARIETVRREARAAAERAELWSGIWVQRRDLLPDEMPDNTELRELELEVLEAELGAAEARVEALARRLGAGFLRSHGDGFVDRIEVGPGAVVEAGAALVTYFDPDSLRVIAYADASEVGRVAVGETCGLVLRGRSEVVEGRVASIGASLVPLPAAIADIDHDDEDYHLPVRVEGLGETSFLRPNMRLKVVLPRVRRSPR